MSPPQWLSFAAPLTFLGAIDVSARIWIVFDALVEVRNIPIHGDR
jgi:hypothetical protein